MKARHILGLLLVLFASFLVSCRWIPQNNTEKGPTNNIIDKDPTNNDPLSNNEDNNQPAENNNDVDNEPINNEEDDKNQQNSDNKGEDPKDNKDDNNRNPKENDDNPNENEEDQHDDKNPSDGNNDENNPVEENPEDKKNEDNNPEPVDKKLTFKQIYEKGLSLSEGETSIEVTFTATYIKAITDNMDKLMLFTADDCYLAVRVVGGFNDFLKIRYLLCDYEVTGTLTKKDNHVEVTYKSLTNVTSTPSSFNYSNITNNVNTIKDVYDLMSNITLTNKKNGYGAIVTFKGVCIATDRDDANKKAVLYDNNNLITIIGEKKVCGADDINKEYTITGIISILKGEPAILVLDYKFNTEKTINLTFENAKEVNPSYFSKWYHVSDKISDPSYLDFSYLYKVTGYVNTDSGRNGFYFGLTDDGKDSSLNDNKIKTSVKGIYLMNFQKQDKLTSSNEIIYNAYQNESKIEGYISLYQFDTQNHAWKCFLYEPSFKVVE